MPLFRDVIRKMKPYKPPLEGRSDRDYTLLDFNERTIGTSPEVKEALKNFIDDDRLQVYPEYGTVEREIAGYAEIKDSHVIITNGGDQGIDIICRAHLSNGDKVIIPFPGFAMHYQSAGIQGAEFIEPVYNSKDGSFPLDKVIDLIKHQERIRLVILCNPNNPLGTPIEIDDVKLILEEAKGRDIPVLHDEAYFEFSGITCKDFIDKYDNLYIIRTFSKAFGLVATRVGYVISQDSNLEELLKIRGPYDVNMFAKVAVLAALKDRGYMEDYVNEVMKVSKPKLEGYLKNKGVKFFPSKANFLFLPVDNSEAIIDGLKDQGILVRPKQDPDGHKRVRVGVGTSEDTDALIRALDKIL
ncbi:aminotransferase class I/II-fold pyridoxal phosphate-dependent enzyme [Candidatus Poribacteria bacterium]|nr:aminotransferase class I/II-fold pyridoxal phosphate-dependent enzyme [Candidatus Poribacteria bacterium]